METEPVPVFTPPEEFHSVVRGLARRVRNQLIGLRYLHHPEEACGMIFRPDVIVEVPNEAPDPTREYFISPETTLDVVNEMGNWPIAVFHTHAVRNAFPSIADLRQLKDLGTRNATPLMFIAGADGLRLWTLMWQDEIPIPVEIDIAEGAENPHGREIN